MRSTMDGSVPSYVYARMEQHVIQWKDFVTVQQDGMAFTVTSVSSYSTGKKREWCVNHGYISLQLFLVTRALHSLGFISYASAFLSAACAMGKYGQGCQLSCPCPLETACNGVSGACSCPSGFMGPFCNISMIFSSFYSLWYKNLFCLKNL